MGAIRGVLFDLDGVLVSTDELHYQSWRRIADAEGIPFERADNARLLGIGRLECTRIVASRADRPFSDESLRAIADRKNELFCGLFADNPPPPAAAAESLLAALRARRVRLAVASSSRNARMILDRIGLTDRFDAVADGNDIQQSKPHPEVFLAAADRLNLRPEECVVIEDGAAGVAAAQRAGMAVFGIGEAGALTGVVRTVGSLAELSADTLLRVAHPG